MSVKISTSKFAGPVTQLHILRAQKAGLEARLAALEGCPTNTDETYSKEDKKWVTANIDDAKIELEEINSKIDFLEYKIEDWITDHAIDMA